MQINKIESSQSYNPKFGMVVKATEPVTKFLEENLSRKGADDLKKIIASEKNSLIDVYLKTSKDKVISGFTVNDKALIPVTKEQEIFEVQVKDKIFRNNSLLEAFSPSKAIISTIKKAVKYARKIAGNKEALKDLK